MKTKTMKIDPNKIPVRDSLVVLLINGATKTGAHVDRRKAASRDACRKFDARRHRES